MVVLEDQAGAELARVRASAFFSDALKGVSDPITRRGIISGVLVALLDAYRREAPQEMSEVEIAQAWCGVSVEYLVQLEVSEPIPQGKPS